VDSSGKARGASEFAEQTNLTSQHPAVAADFSAAWAKWNQQNIPPLWGLPPGVRK
jgi:hypothetical protein